MLFTTCHQATQRRAAILLLAATLGGCSALPAPSAPPMATRMRAPEQTGDAATLYVIDRGWHTDIGFPATEVTMPLAQLGQGFAGARTLVVGFGDRAYVLPGGKGFFGMLQALVPGRGLLLVTALRTTPQRAFGARNVVTLRLSRAGLDRVMRFVWHDTTHGAADRPHRVGDGPYPGSMFYASSATYAGYYTCNTWTADALHSAGLPVSASGILLADQLMENARAAANQQAAARRLAQR